MNISWPVPIPTPAFLESNNRGIVDVPRSRNPPHGRVINQWSGLYRNNSQESLVDHPLPPRQCDAADYVIPRSYKLPKKLRRLSTAEVIAGLPPLITSPTIRKATPELTPIENDTVPQPTPPKDERYVKYMTASTNLTKYSQRTASAFPFPLTPPITPEDTVNNMTGWSRDSKESSTGGLSPDELAERATLYQARQGADASFGLGYHTEIHSFPSQRMSTDGGSLHRSESLRRLGTCHVEYAVGQTRELEVGHLEHAVVDYNEEETEPKRKMHGRKRSLRESIMWNLMKRPRNLSR